MNDGIDRKAIIRALDRCTDEIHYLERKLAHQQDYIQELEFQNETLRSQLEDCQTKQ